jgi:hypothetical protein
MPMTDLSILEQKDQLASRSSQRRARSAAPAKRRAFRRKPVPSDRIATRIRDAWSTRTVLDSTQGRTWSDLLFTMSNSKRLPGEPGPVVDPYHFWTSKTGHCKRAVLLRSSLVGGSDKNFVEPEIFRRNLSRNGCRTENCRNRRPSACQNTGSSGRTPWPTIGSQPPIWWSQTGSNRRPPACKAGALPTELWPLRGSVTRRQ